MSLPGINFLHLTVSEIQPGQTLPALRAVGVKITVAALCIAHAFESAHPQSYVIAHKLLIRCF